MAALGGTALPLCLLLNSPSASFPLVEAPSFVLLTVGAACVALGCLDFQEDESCDPFKLGGRLFTVPGESDHLCLRQHSGGLEIAFPLLPYETDFDPTFPSEKLAAGGDCVLRTAVLLVPKQRCHDLWGLEPSERHLCCKILSVMRKENCTFLSEEKQR